MLPFISVIIPCRNEARFIGGCIESVIANDYPKERMEIIIVDGMSNDGTVEIIDKYKKQCSHIYLLRNERKIVPVALNIGIKHAKGEIIIRIDAHNIYPKDYIVKSIKYLLEYNVDNVGGSWITMPSDDGIWSRSIATALSHPFGVGDAYYRIGVKEPKYVDTVPFGCYKKATLEKIGMFDEELVRNQDDELNSRIIKRGGRILLVPDIISYYYSRDSLVKLWKLYFQYGYFKPLAAKKIGAILTWRQLIPVCLMLILITTCILSFVSKTLFWLFIGISLLYLLVSITISAVIAIKKSIVYFFTLPIVFATLHFGYGIGYLKGLVDFVLLKKNNNKILADIPITR